MPELIKIINSIPVSSLPRHVVFVPDGNRRWAQKNHLSAIEGHRAGTRTFEKILKLAYTSGIRIKSLSFWALSLDNVKHRSALELKGLFQIFNEAARRILDFPEIHRAKVRVSVLGEWERHFPVEVRENLRRVVNETAGYDHHYLNLFLAYDGYQEILEAVEKIRRFPPTQKITPKLFKSCLYTKDLPPVDFVIRTGGEPHWSAGAFMWDAGYSQLYFTKKLWPDFSPQDFFKAMLNYTQRDRRFGR
jgi:undecaprenyl diphosphate synthase